MKEEDSALLSQLDDLLGELRKRKRASEAKGEAQEAVAPPTPGAATAAPATPAPSKVQKAAPATPGASTTAPASASVKEPVPPANLQEEVEEECFDLDSKDGISALLEEVFLEKDLKACDVSMPEFERVCSYFCKFLTDEIGRVL